MVLKVWGVLRIRIKLMLTPWQHLGELGAGGGGRVRAPGKPFSKSDLN